MNAETTLEMVTRHVVEGDRHIQAQIVLIDRLRERVLDTTCAEKLLSTFKDMQMLHRSHLARLLEL